MSIFLVCASCEHLQCLESENYKLNPLQNPTKWIIAAKIKCEIWDQTASTTNYITNYKVQTLKYE